MTTPVRSPRYQVQGTTLNHQDPRQAVANAIAGMNPIVLQILEPATPTPGTRPPPPQPCWRPSTVIDQYIPWRHQVTHTYRVNPRNGSRNTPTPGPEPETATGRPAHARAPPRPTPHPIGPATSTPPDRLGPPSAPRPGHRELALPPPPPPDPPSPGHLTLPPANPAPTIPLKKVRIPISDPPLNIYTP